MDWVLLLHTWDNSSESAGSRYSAFRFNTEKAARNAGIWYESKDSNTQTFILHDPPVGG